MTNNIDILTVMLRAPIHLVLKGLNFNSFFGQLANEKKNEIMLDELTFLLYEHHNLKGVVQILLRDKSKVGFSFAVMQCEDGIFQLEEDFYKLLKADLFLSVKYLIKLHNANKFN